MTQTIVERYCRQVEEECQAEVKHAIGRREQIFVKTQTGKTAQRGKD
jgi:hypothetical protein